MKNILLATDLAANSDRAMERALKLAKETGAKLHIVHALPSYKAKQLSSSLKEDTEDLIKGYIYDYKDSENLNITITALQGGEAFAEILDYAQKIKADLIVMGMHSKAKFRDMFVGTTIERVVRKGMRPVLMVKNKPTSPYQSILAGADFAPGSRAALRMAMDLAPKGVFEVIHAYDVPYYADTAYVYVEAKAILEESHQKTLDAFLKTEAAHYKKEHGGAASKLRGKLLPGPVSEALVKEAKTVKADLIVLGAHGRSVLTPSKLGGVAEDILANPPCDVLVASEHMRT